jgi:signal transduction histidine kinase
MKLQALEEQTALEKERARIARDIHDDLGTRLSEITLLSAMALEKQEPPEQVSDHVRQITQVARQVTDSLDEIVWAVNPRNDSLPYVISYIGQFAMQFLQMAHIHCHLDLPDQPPRRVFPAEARHNLFMVSKEALNNIVRHAGANEAWVKITVNDERLEIDIRDNGRGFDSGNGNENGDGLRNMRQRMANIGGQCRIEGKLGEGSRVVFSQPWSRMN